jgi:excisionase family DNA binding protein
MAKKRKTSISIETHRVVWLRNQRRFRLRCSECGHETSMVSLEEAARLTHVSTREIYRWINGKRMHFTETSYGVLVCLKSLEN